ncbi:MULTISPECIES: LapA family protein [unclassified Sporolactobacillus]|uniref:LapA family protein n=1 Tax=unclassified Sporolactobacillus TaxID=2628533 RepID=UPI0023684F26|nr:LapA family protein [Sporolactobacillus sp. CQH2019]MDD9147667.1 LapA family protein [Sporolactobacillus sp. CQH2019]
MKKQWSLLFALIFILIVVLFSIGNVGYVTFNFLFGSVRLPLILIILGFFLLGAFLVGLFTYYKIYVQQRRIRKLKRELQRLTELHPGEGDQAAADGTPDGEEKETRASRRRSLLKK